MTNRASDLEIKDRLDDSATTLDGSVVSVAIIGGVTAAVFGVAYALQARSWSQVCGGTLLVFLGTLQVTALAFL
jgi:hypothetical protein